MKDITIGITAASYSGNKGAAAMLQSSISQLHEKYGERLNIQLMSVYPRGDREQCPWDFVKVVSCKPEQLLFIAFPLAILYRLFFWLPPIRFLLLKNKILKAYKNTDLVIDEAGISFVDSRGFVMNTYAFVCAAVPLLMGVPVVKYAQAMGTFHSFTNRFLAKWILPKLKLICARGKGTYENLKGIGVSKNVQMCADGAFSMPDDPAIAAAVRERMAADPFYDAAGETNRPAGKAGGIVGLSLSSVVQKKCAKLGIDYVQCMTDFMDWLTGEGYRVLIIANAARIESEKTRNNDLMVCDAVYGKAANPEMVRWYHEEMGPEEIREYISVCRYLVASRFHAMVGALEKEVPVLLIGWSHKYQEVLDDFELGAYANDFSKLKLEDLKASFEAFTQDEEGIREKLRVHHDSVMESSRKNIRLISGVIDEVTKPDKKVKLLDLSHPERYAGPYVSMRKGYAADEAIRANSASGGLVTGLLCHMLESGEIDGAWVSKNVVEDGKLSYRTFIATTKEQLMDASSSIYMSMPLLKDVEMVRRFPGKVAVVLIPCQMKAFSKLLERDSVLKEKVVLKLGLFCSGCHDAKETYLALRKAGISLEHATRLYYRRGHWRGISAVLYEDGSEKHFSYGKKLCTYKNAFYFSDQKCMICQNHFAEDADISFGDLWLRSMKSNPIKHTCCVIRNEKAQAYFDHAVADGALAATHLSGKDMIRGQKRALVFKFNLARAKKSKAPLDVSHPCRWNHRLAWALAKLNRSIGSDHPGVLEKMPTGLMYLYMCFVRFLLSF